MKRGALFALGAVVLVLVLSRPETAVGYGSNLTGGQTLYPGQQLLSANGEYRLIMQTDG